MRFRGGHAPFGYARGSRGKLRVVPDEASAVRRIFREYVRRGSLGRLAASPGVVRPGKTWSRQGLAWMLRNPVYRGILRDGARRVRGSHPPIVPAALFNRVQGLLSVRRRSVRKGQAHAGMERETEARPDRAPARQAQA